VKQSKARSKKKKKSKKGVAKEARVPRSRKPDDMSLEAWQVALRKQFGGQQKFKVKNIGGQPIFSEFKVTNPESKRTYRVAIRGESLGVNYCSCPDYAINTLGTCKHIEFLLAKLRRKAGGQNALVKGYRPAFSEVYLRYGAQREVLFQAGAECPGALKTLAKRFFKTDGTLRPASVKRFHTFLAQAGNNNGHEVRCYDDALAFISQMRDREELVKRITRVFPSSADNPAWRRLLKTRLYAYQRQGALFAARTGRCVIADDMGLGKTVQAIAASEILARCGDISRVLVICPTSLKHQWQREIETFTDRSTVVVEGGLANRQRLYTTDAFYTIVNYDVIHRDLDDIQAGRYDLIVLDEAQRIKNWKTRVAQTVKQLESDHAFVLTGTPLENRLEELHSIVEFVDRHRLGPMFRFLATHQQVDENGKVVGYRRLDEISQTLKPILVRRSKQTVLKELPERLEKRLFVPMTDEQMRHHEENREIVGRIVNKWRRHGYLSEIDQRMLTCALQNMRMSCNSTYLLDKETDHGTKTDELMAWLDDVLEEADAKVVVFSQWLRMQELIVRRLAKRRVGHVLFHGGVPGPKRKDLVATFREDPDCRLFLSTDAGGVGLNLQHASVVANMDLPWNPAVLEQRIGRVHRLGQQKCVRVVNFIAQGTIEEGMLELLSFKQSMFAGVLDGGQKEVFLGGTRLKKFMDTVDKATGSIPNGDGVPASNNKSASATNKQPKATAAATVSPEALGNLLTAGAAFLNQLGESLRQETSTGRQGSRSNSLERFVEKDRATGQTYLKLPLPKQELLDPLMKLLQAFTEGQQ